MPSLLTTLPYFLLPAYISAATLDCTHIRVDGQSFDLSKLGGPKTVHDVRWESPSIQNTTFTIDICDPLKRDSDAKKGEECPGGTRVCAKEWDIKPDTEPYLKEVRTIAGEFSASHGRSRALDPQYTRLKDSAGNSEEKEGVVVELHGGKYPDTRAGIPQKAVVEFLCDRDWTGNEGFEDAGKALMSFGAMSKRKEDDGDEDEPELPDLDKGKALQFVRYEMDTDNAIKILRLRWKTKFACEGAASAPDKDKGDKGGSGDDKEPVSKGWGFFTWLIIVLFLLAAAYIIFGSWLNYNRYGARGWDLIPHGDTIRDIPYIVKDWGTGMAERLRGDGRGGYSAV